MAAVAGGGSGRPSRLPGLSPVVVVERLLRVVLTGSESTGKTTLAAGLAAHYATAWSPEFVREYLDRKRAALVASDLDPIARGQIAGEDAAAGRARRLLVLDTDLLSTVVYGRYYQGRCPEWIEEAARERRGDLYLLHHPDVPWVPDGTQRDRPQDRAGMHGLFRATLQEFGARWVDIRGRWPERRAAAVAAIDALLAGPLRGGDFGTGAKRSKADLSGPG
jgi:NadR type nicotinamide-nucleotide adenylyltransferase